MSENDATREPLRLPEQYLSDLRNLLGPGKPLRKVLEQGCNLYLERGPEAALRILRAPIVENALPFVVSSFSLLREDPDALIASLRHQGIGDDLVAELRDLEAVTPLAPLLGRLHDERRGFKNRISSIVSSHDLGLKSRRPRMTVTFKSSGDELLTVTDTVDGHLDTCTFLARSAAMTLSYARELRLVLTAVAITEIEESLQELGAEVRRICEATGLDPNIVFKHPTEGAQPSAPSIETIESPSES